MTTIPTRLEFVDTPTGQPTIKLNGLWLDDPDDPEQGARIFAKRLTPGDRTPVVLFGGGLGYRPQHISQIQARRPLVFEPCTPLFEHNCQARPQYFSRTAYFGDLAALAQYVRARIRPRDPLLLLAHDAYTRLFPQALVDLKRVLKEAQSASLVAENTLVERGSLIVGQTLANLPRLAHIPLATRLHKPLAGTPAFIVSAGPSLDRNGPHLARAAQHGTIFAVNTSAPAVMAYGAPIDALVVIESLDARRSMAHAASYAHNVVLDLSAAPQNFDIPARQQLVFIAKNPTYDGLSAALQTPPLVYGASVATAAMSLAYAWGADPIVLVGTDLAYTGGRVYAASTPFADMHVVVQANDYIRLEGCPERDEAYTHKGLKTQPRRRSVITADAWGGQGHVLTGYELVLFRQWFESAAHSLQGRRRLVNATEGGARIAGYQELPLASLIDQLPTPDAGTRIRVPPTSHVNPETLALLQHGIRETAQHLAAAVLRCLETPLTSPDYPAAYQQMRRASRTAPFVEAYAAADLVQLMVDTSLSRRTRSKQILQATYKAAQNVIDIMTASFR